MRCCGAIKTLARRAIDIHLGRAYALAMHIELTPAQNSFVDLGIQEGRYRDREEAVKAALALWERRERARMELLSSLDAAEKGARCRRRRRVRAGEFGRAG